jgi:hypothetical protein
MLTTTLSYVEWVVGPDPDSPGFPLQPEADPSEALWRKKHAGMTDLGLPVYLTQQVAANEPSVIRGQNIED